MSFISISLFTVNVNATDVKENNTITLKLPPKALSQWYKPENKRQVWLHTMFRLRREMLAMRDYAELGQQKDLEKWSQKFIKDYQSIGEMIPQWQEHLYLEQINKLETAVKERAYTSIPVILKKIDKSCMHCHDDFQTIATLLYRSADFSQQKVQQKDKTLDYDESMEQLSDSINRINIAIKDSYFEKAENLILPLEQQLKQLSDGCNDCHSKDNVIMERIIGASQQLLPELSEQLKLEDKKQSGRKLGEFAVKVCARCHAVHRLSSDLKQQLQ